MNPTGRMLARGLLAGSAYLAAQRIDLRVACNNVDDRMLLGGIGSTSRSQSLVAGTILHLGNSVAATFVYSTLVSPRLTGPAWWRGVLFASAENVALYPLLLLEDFHPAIRDGRLDSYQNRTAFLQSVWRHLWFGMVLGATERRR